MSCSNFKLNVFLALTYFAFVSVQSRAVESPLNDILSQSDENEGTLKDIQEAPLSFTPRERQLFLELLKVLNKVSSLRYFFT